MDRIPEDEMLKYNPDTMIFMRKSYNLDKPGQIDEAIDLLDAWIKKQNHFVKKDFSKEYLERVIMLQKGSIERAKSQIEKICTLRTLLPQFFQKIDAKNDFKDLNKYVLATLLPRLTADHQRLFVVKIESEPFSPKIFLHMFFYNILVCEYLKAHDYSDGLITVVDYRNITSILEFVTQLNLLEVKQIATIVLKGYATRAKKLILISTSNAIDLLIKIWKQILPEKLRQRIYVARDLEELHKHVPKELLPAEYGGNEKPLAAIFETFQNVMASKENIEYLKEISQARTNEEMRTTKNTNDDFLGIEGSFRSLDFD